MKSRITIFGLLLFVNLLSAQNQLEDIEQTILTAYDKSKETNTDQFQSVYETLNALDSKETNISNYWMAFAKYQQAKFTYKDGQDEKAFSILKEGIKILEAIKNPNSEELALHGSLLSFSIVFERNLAPIISGKAMVLFEKALNKNKDNLRAYLGIAKSDFFKPAQYGGGLKVESYLKQALSKPNRSTESAFGPSWGRDQAYYFLASFFEREYRIDEAKLYCDQGLQKFPDSPLLKTLFHKLNN